MGQCCGRKAISSAGTGNNEAGSSVASDNHVHHHNRTSLTRDQGSAESFTGRRTNSHNRTRRSSGGFPWRRSLIGSGSNERAQRFSDRMRPQPTSSSYSQLVSLARDLVKDILGIVNTLVTNDQEPPESMVKLHVIADTPKGWIAVVQSLIEQVQENHSLGPAVITLFLDECPLTTIETVLKLLEHLQFSAQLANDHTKAPLWHRNVCIVLGCLAEKFAGRNSVATFKRETMEYLTANLEPGRLPNVSLFALIALEKYARTGENKVVINRKLHELDHNPLLRFEKLVCSDNYFEHQLGFCAQWLLDNMFICEGRPYTYTTVDTSTINVMLNHNDVSELLKISPDGLEARCETASFESVRCTFQVTRGVWYYEVLIITPGVMQIGWATKNSGFANHDGYGIGDDEYSVAYDGCRQLIWHNAKCFPNNHPSWKPGDIVGSLLDLVNCQVNFYLNGVPMMHPHTDLFRNTRGSGFFAAASFMSFQQCRFNFGGPGRPFRFPPSSVAFQAFNDHATLTDDERCILPRPKKLELIRACSTQENACSVCYGAPGNTILRPCLHGGFCSKCSLLFEQCPLCRCSIEQRIESSMPSVNNTNSSNIAVDSTSANDVVLNVLSNETNTPTINVILSGGGCS